MSTDAYFVPRSVPVLRSDRVAEVEAAASARGYAAGYAAGARAARDEAERLRAALEADHARRTAERDERTARAVAVLREAARALGERTVPVVAAAQDATVRGALDLAGAVLGYELTDRPGAARAALARATAVADGAVVAVRLHPDDVSLLTEAGVDDVRLVADASLDRGDAVAELEHGFLDARVRAAVDRARAELALLDVGPDRTPDGGPGASGGSS